MHAHSVCVCVCVCVREGVRLLTAEGKSQALGDVDKCPPAASGHTIVGEEVEEKKGSEEERERDRLAEREGKRESERLAEKGGKRERQTGRERGRERERASLRSR